MRSAKGSRRNAPKSTPTTVCYCNGKRELGSIEIVCSQCLRWFHGRCLKEYHELINNGVPFMICYSFTCKECRPSSEDWKAKKAELVQMCVTVFATLSAEKLKEAGQLSVDIIPEDYTYLSLKDTIIPYMNENWPMLTSIKQRNGWHQNLEVTLLKEKNMFVQSAQDSDYFSLAEKNLALLGPLHEAVKNIGKKPAVDQKREERVIELPPIEGPKTRGASKRRNAEGPAPGKKQKLASEYSSTAIAGNQVDFPFSKDGYRYFLTETDPHVVADDSSVDNKTAYAIPPHSHRVVVNTIVSVSSNDRAYQLSLEQNNTPFGPTWSVTGHEGYAQARATHGVTKGTWYYEVVFDEHPEETDIRIGWSQPYAALQSCVGYNKFSYGWRSKHGTKFHDARGVKYHFGGFTKGDILGCLIHLPVDPKTLVPEMSSLQYLPQSHKDATLISFKNNLFFEVHDEATDVLKELKELPNSRVEFFKNGKSCGVAFENIYGGCYHPAVSLFYRSRVTVNLGPKFRYLPKYAKGMHLRAEEQQYEQALSDMLHLVTREL